MEMQREIENAGDQAKPLRSTEVILGLLPLAFGLQLIVWIICVPQTMHGNSDFRAYYSGARLVASGQGELIYDDAAEKTVQDNSVSYFPTVLPFTHPAYEALFFVPFTLTSYRFAYLAFLAFNVLCLFCSYLLLGEKMSRWRQGWKWLPATAMIGFMPVSVALIQGQDSLLLLVLAAAALRVAGKNDLLAGIVLGLGIFKFQILLPIVLLFLVWRKWHVVFGWALSTAGAVVFSFQVTGIRGLHAYADKLYSIGLKRHGADLTLYGVPVARMPNLRGLLVTVGKMAPHVSVPIILIASAIILIIAAWGGRETSPQWQLAIGLSAATLVGYHVLTHDLSLLLIPMSVLLSENPSRGLWSVTVVWISTALCFFGLDYMVALPVLALFFVLVFVARRTRARTGKAVPVLSYPSSDYRCNQQKESFGL